MRKILRLRFAGFCQPFATPGAIDQLANVDALDFARTDGIQHEPILVGGAGEILIGHKNIAAIGGIIQ